MALEHDWDLESVDFPLTSKSVVLEIGGYCGRWALEIAQRYNPNIHVFEPQEWAFEKCLESLKDFPATKVYNVALGVESGSFPMGNWETDGCSFVNVPDRKPSGNGIMAEIGKTLDFLHIDHIDVCLMNIEGYEFKLIPYMIENGIMDRIDYFMCQFHTFNDQDEQAYYDIRRSLGVNKKVRFYYGKVLTCWEPK